MPSAPTLLHITPPPHHRFHLLDLIRGLAAIFVALFHTPPELGSIIPAHNAFLAVDLFFGLSGFVIAFSYENRLSSGLSWQDFIVARILRLWPLYLLGSLTGLIHFAVFYHLHLGFFGVSRMALFAIFMLPDFRSNVRGLFPLDRPAWSLLCELIANAAYGWLVVKRFAGNLVLSALSAAFLIGLFVWILRFGTLNGGSTPADFLVGPLRVGFSFFLGVILFRIYRASRTSISGASAPILAALLTTLLTVSLTASFASTATMQMLSAVLFFPVIIYLGASIALPASLHRLATFLGETSYPLYLIHVHGLSFFDLHIVARYLNLHPALRPYCAPLMLPCLLALSWVLARFYDLPVRRSLIARYNAFPHTLVKRTA